MNYLKKLLRDTKEPKLKGSIYTIIIKIKFIKFILLFILGYIFLAFIFSIIYYKGGFTSAISFYDNLYFSVMTQTTMSYGEFIPKTIFGRLTVSIQAITGILYTSIFIAILLYKLINVSTDIIEFEKYAVFTPGQGTLRIRAINFFKLPIIDVNVKIYFRIWHDKLKSFSTYDICLKNNTIPFMDTKKSWNFTSKPFNLDKQVPNIEDLDSSRKIVFHPKYMNKKYIPKNAADKTLLTIHIKGEIPLFGKTIHFFKSYKNDEILCGRYADISLDTSEIKWENFGIIIESSLQDCENCEFNTDCGIITNQKNIKV